MRYRKYFAIFAVSLLLVLTTGCQHSEDKPLWERLDEAQYNRYKPRLDHMIEKYGEEFTMDNYGTVFSVEHPQFYSPLNSARSNSAVTKSPEFSCISIE